MSRDEVELEEEWDEDEGDADEWQIEPGQDMSVFQVSLLMTIRDVPEDPSP